MKLKSRYLSQGLVSQAVEEYHNTFVSPLVDRFRSRKFAFWGVGIAKRSFLTVTVIAFLVIK